MDLRIIVDGAVPRSPGRDVGPLAQVDVLDDLAVEA
jgi:hypothetical protein